MAKPKAKAGFAGAQCSAAEPWCNYKSHDVRRTLLKDSRDQASYRCYCATCQKHWEEIWTLRLRRHEKLKLTVNPHRGSGVAGCADAEKGRRSAATRSDNKPKPDAGRIRGVQRGASSGQQLAEMRS